MASNDPDPVRAYHTQAAALMRDTRARVSCAMCNQQFDGASLYMAAARFSKHVCAKKAADASS